MVVLLIDLVLVLLLLLLLLLLAAAVVGAVFSLMRTIPWMKMITTWQRSLERRGGGGGQQPAEKKHARWQPPKGRLQCLSRVSWVQRCGRRSRLRRDFCRQPACEGQCVYTCVCVCVLGVSVCMHECEIHGRGPSKICVLRTTQ